MDSNACRAAEVERKVCQDNDFLLPVASRNAMARRGQSLSQPSQKRAASRAASLLALERTAPATLFPSRSKGSSASCNRRPLAPKLPKEPFASRLGVGYPAECRQILCDKPRSQFDPKLPLAVLGLNG